MGRMTPKLTDIGNRILLFDGAMGTILGDRVGRYSGPIELMNVTHPEVVSSVHRDYMEAGADIVTTNTLGANRLRLFRHGMGYRVEDLNIPAVEAAKVGVGDSALVAGSIGPSGKLMEPFGDVRFEEIYDAYYEQAIYLAKGGVDLFSIETINDLGELRAAIMACRAAASGIPVIASLSFAENRRTIWGTDPLTFVSAISPHKTLAIGVNCSLGPEGILPIVEDMCAESPLPVSVMPNAGMPKVIRGKTTFPLGPEEMAEYSQRFAEVGASIIGSCCGSTPAHTAAIAAKVKGKLVRKTERSGTAGPVCRLSSAGQTVRIGHGFPIIPIGERINPTGKKKLSAELATGLFTRLTREARRQTADGALLLDINVGVPDTDETWLMRQAVKEVQKVVALPLSIDSISINALEAGLKGAIGRPLVNSVTADPAKMSVVLPMVKKFGAAVIGLCLDGKAIPRTPEERLEKAKYILDAAREYGLNEEDILFDPLTLTIGSESNSAAITLSTLRLLKSELNANSVIGLSNISHGMPQRPLLNSAFLSMAAEAGLDAVIIDPSSQVAMGFLYAVNILTGKEPKATRILKRLAVNGFSLSMGDASAKKKHTTSEEKKLAPHKKRDDSTGRLIKIVMEGDGDAGAKLVQSLVESGKSPDTILDEALIPAMERVSEMFSDADFFLPEALLASEAFKECLKVIQKHQKKKTRAVKGKVVLSTVQGDIHDIGKNLVKLVLENAGYFVHDLGANIPARDIIEAAREDGADIVALSALMTTTMSEMHKVVRGLRKMDIDSDVMVGGAVLTAQYAEKIGASGYGADAMAGLRKADNIMRTRRRKIQEH